MTSNNDTRLSEVMDERIDHYLKKQMSREEEMDFERDLKSDAELRSRARFIAQSIKAMMAAEKGEGMMDVPQQTDFKAAAKNPLARKKGKK